MTDTYTRGQVTAALGIAHGQLDEATDTGPVGPLTVGAWAELARLGTGPFTYDQVKDALNAAANALDDAAGYETSETIWAQDVRNLAVNTALHQLAHPGASLAEAIVACYAEDLDVSPGEPSEAGSERDAAIVDTVLGWVS